MLLGNYSVLSKIPARFRGGSTVSAEVNVIANYQGSGPRRNRLYVSGQTAAYKLMAVPTGYYPPGAWIVPQVSGEVGAMAAMVVSPSANLAAGRNIEGDTSITVTVPDALLQLVVSAVGSTSVTFTADGTLAGALSAAGATNISVTVPTATLGAIIDAIAAAQISVSASANIRATGALAGDITPFTELSPQSLADAVWSALSSEYQTAGTMGELLNSAGAAADPLLGVVEDTLTLRDVMRILLAVAGGDATGLEGGTMVFKAQDGSTVRVQATYASGDRTITTLDPT